MKKASITTIDGCIGPRSNDSGITSSLGNAVRLYSVLTIGDKDCNQRRTALNECHFVGDLGGGHIYS